MAGPNSKLVAAVEAYFSDLRRVRSSGGATGERSYYPALEGLLRAVGATLKPKVLCVQELAAVGAPAMADLRSSRRPRFLSDPQDQPMRTANP